MHQDQQKCSRKMCQNRSKETNEALLLAGIKLFALHGYYKVNTKDIAKEAGVAIGSFYGYYEDKKQLFMAILRTYKQALIDSGRCPKTSEKCAYNLEDVMQYFINRRLQVAGDYPLAFLREINYLKTREPDIAELFNFYYEQELNLFVSYMQQHVHLLRVKDLSLSAKLIYELNENMINAYMSTDSEAEKIVTIEAYKDLLNRYLFEA